MTFVNLTPHMINIRHENGDFTRISSTGIARVSSTSEVVDTIRRVPIVKTTFGEVTGLPAPVEGTYYIVSAMVQNACKDRTDLLVPNHLVRDDDGNIIGCKSLSR